MRSPVIVSIDGHGGAGKTFLARKLATRLSRMGIVSQIVHVDDFYLPSKRRSERTRRAIGGEFDWRRLESQVLHPLCKGRSSHYRVYDWPSDRLGRSASVRPRGVVLVEGVYTSRRELSGYYDFKIWVKCPRRVCLDRERKRDGSANLHRLVTWMAQESRYIQLHVPHRRADIVIDGR